MASNTEAINQSLENVRANRETLAFLQIGPRLRSKFRARRMRNRTILLLVGVSLCLVFGWASSTLEAQLPQRPFDPAQQQKIEQMLQQATERMKFQSDPAQFPRDPGIPPPRFQHRPPDWVEYLDHNPYLAAPLFAAVVTLALAIFIGIPYRIILGLIHVLSSRRGRDTGDASTSQPAKRVPVVVLLLVIGLALAFIVHSVVNDSR